MATVKVTSTGVSPDDKNAIQAQIDAASDDDIIQLEQLDAATKFNFGAADFVTVDKQLTIEGLGVPTIVGGKSPITVDASGKDVTIKNILIQDTYERGIYVKKAKDISLLSCRVVNDTGEGRGISYANGASSQQEEFVAFCLLDPIGSNGTLPVINNISGDVIIDGCYTNQEAGADPDDPYAGNRRFINPLSGTGGLITCVPSGNLIDGETFILNDGANPAVTFEFDDDDSVTQTDTLRKVDISGGPHTKEQVAAIVIAAINAAPTLEMYASPGQPATVKAQKAHLVGVILEPGGGTVEDITHTVADAGFTVAGMVAGEGGGWPWGGVTDTRSWVSHDILYGVGHDEQRVTVQNCVLKNQTSYGIWSLDHLGYSYWERNYVDSPYGMHRDGSTFGGSCMLHTNSWEFFEDASLLVLKGTHGHISMKKNVMRRVHGNCYFAGVFPNWNQGENGWQKTVSVTQQDGHTDKGIVNAYFRSVKYGYIGQNLLSGTGWMGFGIGNLVARIAGTDNNVFVGNNLNKFASVSAPYWATAFLFSADCKDNTIIGSGHARDQIAFFPVRGEGNVVLSQGDTGEVGAALQAVLDNLKTSGL